MRRISTTEAIDGYWKALDAWRAASRKERAIAAKLPAELKRPPRVQHGYFMKDGRQIPMFVHAEFEIRDVVAKRREVFGHLAHDQKRFEARLADLAKELRRGLEADSRALETAQTEAGWTQARNNANRCVSRIYSALDKVRYSQIGSHHEAVALIEFVAKVTDQAYRSKNHVPFGLTDCRKTAFLRKAAAHLSGEAQDSLKEAA